MSSIKSKLKWILPTLLGLGFTTLVGLIIYVQKQQQVPFPFNLILTNECGVKFFVDYDVFNRKCLQMTLSKLLSYSIVTLSTTLKVPIINNIINMKSTVGLSSVSVVLENFALASGFTAALKKNFPFSLWGEVFIIFVQNFVILFLARYYSPKGKEDPHILLLLSLVAFTVTIILVDEISADFLVFISTLIAISSRVPQIYFNFVQKHTGVLSLFTQILQCLGVVVRLFTVIVETSDKAQILSYSIALVLNGLLLGQVLIYWENTKRELAKTSEKTQKKKQ